MVTLRQEFDKEKIIPKPIEMNEVNSLGENLRCPICTLPPPCKHISKKELVHVAKARIKAMNQCIDPDLPFCPSYMKTGACEAMTLLGYCRLNHPIHLYKYVSAIKRCPICTIPEPCNMCQWFKIRKAIGKLVCKGSNEIIILKNKGKRATVSLAKYRSQFDLKVLQFEELLNDNAKWLNCNGHEAVAANLTDQFLIQGKYSTNESECRYRYQQLKTKYQTIIPKLELWLSGNDKNDKNNKNNNNLNNYFNLKSNQKYHRAVAEISSIRYMPSEVAAPLHSNGYAEDEFVQDASRTMELPIVKIHYPTLKMGIIDKLSTRKKGGLGESEVNEEEDRKKLLAVNEERKTRSVFAKSPVSAGVKKQEPKSNKSKKK